MHAVQRNGASALRDLVVCPICRGSLAFEVGRVRCATCNSSFRVVDDVPYLVPAQEAPKTSGASRLRGALFGNARLYDLHQWLCGGPAVAARTAAYLDRVAHGTVVDIGAGTGAVGEFIPAGAQYVWIDNDESKLREFKSKELGGFAVLGEAQHLPFRDQGCDWSVMVEVSHHLPEDVLNAAFQEIARVTRERFVFVDMIRAGRLRSAVVQRFDLGRFPRTEHELLSALEEHFVVESSEILRVYHDHLICACVPKRAAQ